MRTIKFRIFNKKMFEPFDLNHCIEGDAATISEDAILMQYTGLKDKKGKEIYEGDIIGNEACGYYEIYWDDNDHGYRAIQIKETNGIALWYLKEEAIILAGNIYENKELLKTNE